MCFVPLVNYVNRVQTLSCWKTCWLLIKAIFSGDEDDMSTIDDDVEDMNGEGRTLFSLQNTCF